MIYFSDFYSFLLIKDPSVSFIMRDEEVLYASSPLEMKGGMLL